MDILDPTCAARSLGPANNLISAFISSIVALHCNISSSDTWPTDYGSYALGYGLDEYDFVIVGSGSAGSVVAGRLAENIDNNVLLIEAGQDPPIETEIPAFAWFTFGSEIDWFYSTKSNGRSCLGSKNEDCLWSRGKLLGGSHSLNGLVYHRGNPRDYDIWAQQGNPTWEWNNVFDYFKKAEMFRGDNKFGLYGTHGPVNVEQFQSPKLDQFMITSAARELGYPEVNNFADQYVGFGRFYGTIEEGRRMSTARAFLSQVRPNLHVIKSALARRINFNKSKKASSVSIVYKGKHRVEIKAQKEIILSAGVVETPKLLMLSGIGPKDHLDSLGIPVTKDLPVGNNLQDQVRVDVLLKLKYREKLGLDVRFLDAFYNQLVHRSGSYGMPGLDLGCFIDTDGNGYYPDIQFAFTPVDNITLFAGNLKPYIVQHIESQFDSSSHRLFVVMVVLLKPESKGYIRLQSKDYRHAPLIFPNHLQNDDDSKRIVQGIQRLLELENTQTFRELEAEFLKLNIPECDQYEYRGTEYWECYSKYMSNTVWNAGGTAKMGPRKDKDAVVDSELKVRGVKGLRVVDASILPTLVSGPINAAVIMTGEKGADFVKGDWNY